MSDKPVSLHWFYPFMDFRLTAMQSGSAIEVVQPAWDHPVEPREMNLDPQRIVEFNPPITLRFDPNVPPNGGGDSARWTLRADAATTELEAEMLVKGAEIGRCRGTINP